MPNKRKTVADLILNPILHKPCLYYELPKAIQQQKKKGSSGHSEK